MITTISVSINYIICIISSIINYCIFRFLSNNTYIILLGTLGVYVILYKLVCNVKKLKKGIAFLKKNEHNEYLGLLILNIATAIFFSLAILGNMKTNMEMMKSLFIYIVFFTIIMFITIQKSLQLYYKQKLQII